MGVVVMMPELKPCECPLSASSGRKRHHPCCPNYPEPPNTWTQDELDTAHAKAKKLSSAMAENVVEEYGAPTKKALDAAAQIFEKCVTLKHWKGFASSAGFDVQQAAVIIQTALDATRPDGGDSLRAQPSEVLKAADYYIGRLERVISGKVTRDLDEAEAYYKTERAKLPLAAKDGER